MALKFDLTTLSIALKIWRNMHGFTIADMAELAGMAKSSYGFVEQGERVPTMAEFANLCEIIGFSPERFFHDA